ncbi:DUF362 domain-containing protein [bacterium]|nr:DUF362 domain-containing protein [bacterium]
MKTQESGITRRDFLRGTAFAALSSTLGMTIAGRTTCAAEGKEPVSKVFLIRRQNALDEMHRVNRKVLSEMLDKVVCAVAGTEDAAAAWKTFVKSDDTVGLVPTPALGGTHKEVTELVKEKLAFAGIQGEKILHAQGKKGVHKKCSVLIPLPNLKAHWLTGIGTVLKNYILFSGKASAYHKEKSKDLGRIWTMPGVKGKSRIVIVDALRPLFDKGPQVVPQYLWHYNGIIAGTDPVAVEAVCLKIIQAKRDLFKGEPWPLSPPPTCIEAADKVYHVGCSDLSKIELVKMGWEEGILV